MDARCRGVMSKINFYEKISKYTVLHTARSGNIMIFAIEFTEHAKPPALRSGNCKKEVRRRLSPGQITRQTRQVQDQSQRYLKKLLT